MSISKRPRLLIHIGTHKTGTSGLQLSLAEHRALLLSRGICYPETAREPHPELPKHCSVYRAAVSTDTALQDAERRWLLAQADQPGVHTVLVSEEGLSEPQPDITAFFAPLAESMDLEVLCCLRRQDLFVESLFNQFVREPARHEGRPPMLFARAQKVRSRLDYHGQLMRWAALTPQVHVADFDQVRSSEGLLNWLARVGRLDLSGLSEQRANPSPDMRLAVLLSRLNRAQVAYSLPAMMKAARSIAARNPTASSKYLLGRAERLRLLTESAASNNALAADFGVRFSDQLPAGEMTHAAEAPDSLYLDELLGELSLAAARDAA